MIEFAKTVEEVGARLAEGTVPGGVTVIGPALDGGLGITTRHGGHDVHLGIGPLREHRFGRETILMADGKLYLDPLPEGEGRPFSELVREWLPGNCALIDLPGHFEIWPDQFRKSQVVWQVDVVISGPGLAEPNLKQNMFNIMPKQPFLSLSSARA